MLNPPRIRISKSRTLPGIGFWLLVPLLSTGCFGPQAMQSTRLRYNEAYRTTNDEQLLLNIVRLRYAETPVLIDLPAITGQYEIGAAGGFNSPFDSLDPGIPNFAIGQMMLRDQPTLSYHPREGHEIAQTLVEPLNVELLRVISPGADTLRFLMMAVNDINDVPNAPLATSMIPRVPDENSHFRLIADLLVSLQERGAVELGIATFEGDQFDALPTRQVNGRAMLDAAKEGYSFQIQGETAALRKHEKSVVLRIRPSELNAPDVLQLETLLTLRPGQSLYRIRAEQTEEETPDDLLPDPLGDERIKINMRSVLNIMVFLSKGVCVPPEHIAEGTAPTTPGYDCAVHDWRDVTAGLITVRSQKHRPAHADVAVAYRGHWYYIEKSDVTSRATLSLLELLLELQETERDQQAPLLTLPL